MSKAAFFGHRNFGYGVFSEKIEATLVDLIENYGVVEFYNGFRGNFDEICAEKVFLLKTAYPNIKNIMVLSYYPKEDFVLPRYFDESVYLLDRKVPPKFAIYHTNRKLVDIVDYVVSGVKASFGGAREACDYARARKKPIFEIIC